jgi:uncharacterized protein (TIRG00374 family)
MQSRARAVLIFVVTVGLLGYFVRNGNIAAVWAETRRAELAPLLLALAMTLVTYALRALRWQYLLAPIGPTHFSTAFRTTVIGFAASFLLPARAGEVIRPYLLARRENLNAASAFATIILERLLDLLTVLLLFGWFVFLGAPGVVASDPGELARVKFGGLVAGLGAIAGSIVFFALAGHPERMGKIALRIERVLPAKLAAVVANLVTTFSQGLAVLRQPRRIFVALLLSVPLWLGIAFGIWLASRAFHITFPFTASFLVMTVLVVGVAVPTPGAIGGFHAAYKFAVETFFAASPDRAIGGAFVLHGISFIPVTLLGILFMAQEGLTLSGARAIAAEGKEGPAEKEGKLEPSGVDTPGDDGWEAGTSQPIGTAQKRPTR